MQTHTQDSGFFTLRPYQRPLRSSIYNIRKIYNPHWFQGNTRRQQYFEGWYFKNVSNGGEHCWSFIPGISLVKDDAHAFVQAINGNSGETCYFRFPASEFLFANEGFRVQIGNNYFSDQHIILDLDNGKDKIKGQLHFENITPYPGQFTRPGIMGWYRYVPFMECYHGVVSFDHGIRGQLSINDVEAEFNGGRGYIEKDWGSSMPKAWIWMQTNHFDSPETSFMLSVARIPWITKTFTGFLGFFLHQGHLIHFATYTGARITRLEHSDTEASITIEGKKYIIHVYGEKPASLPGAPKLKAPVLGNMDRMIHESLNANLRVTVKEKSSDNILFTGQGRHAGLEFVGDLKLLAL